MAQIGLDDHSFVGVESRVVTDNWFRAARRRFDLSLALEPRGILIPPPENLFGPIDVDLMSDEFTIWHEQTHGTFPDPDLGDALAEEWMEGTLPESWFLVSPRRVEFQLSLINDWTQDDPITEGALDLMPQWVRWLGERVGLPASLISRAVAVCDR